MSAPTFATGAVPVEPPTPCLPAASSSSCTPTGFEAHALPAGTLHLQVERSELPVQQLFVLAARNNPRRAFLFVSRVLAKHLPVAPAVVQDCHERIASRIPAQFGAQPGPVLFIGMAETATGLGQGVFDAWQRQHPGAAALYLHTSRYRAVGAQALAFEESHSHAPQVFLHLPTDPVLHAQFVAARALVLVDDEISTGNTFVHLAHTCFGQAPHIERVHLASITDFCGAARAGLQARMGRPLTTGALLDGAWTFTPHAPPGHADGAAEAPVAPPAQAAQAAPAVKENVHGLDLDKFAGITQNTHGPNDIVKIDEHGNQWLQVEVRKADGLKPRGRRRLRFDNPAVTVSEIRGEDGTMESFEIPDTSKPTTPSEVRITLPSFQTGIYRSPSFPFRIHTYNGARGFDLEDVQNYYGGKDLVPSSVKKMYVYTDLCYDIPSVVSTIREEHARLVLNNSSKEVLR